MNHEPDTAAPMRAIFKGLQDLLEAAAPSMRSENPQRYADAMQMVASGRASFAAKVSTDPGIVTLTITCPEGDTDLVSFIWSGGALN